MPTYDFRCIECKRNVEVDCLMKDRDKTYRCNHEHETTCDGILTRVYSGTYHFWQDCEQPGGYVPKGKAREAARAYEKKQDLKSRMF